MNPSTTRHGNWEYTLTSTPPQKRRLGTTPWIPLDPPPPPSPPSTQLHLIRERQLPGEPDHWSLFLSPEGQKGSVFQVRGDAMAMYHDHLNDMNPFVGDCFRDSFVVAELGGGEEEGGKVEGAVEGGLEKVRFWVNEETPPRAERMVDVRENCQGWCVRVLKRLSGEGVVGGEWVERVEGMMDVVK